jgi:hypothetical protein
LDLQNSADNPPPKQRGTHFSGKSPARFRLQEFRGDVPDQPAIRLRMPIGQFCYREKNSEGDGTRTRGLQRDRLAL